MVGWQIQSEHIDKRHLLMSVRRKGHGVSNRQVLAQHLMRDVRPHGVTDKASAPRMPLRKVRHV